ncbi:asparagine synthase (glutamine-hydrolyzing) [Plantactinospora sp. CA-294935]|uniref:asparagine synthase (glutamine-hydrolyzing) n=1 Tax=Plantactinospora sp. CA-294935 TaxID=3240012 RepID=UPI003D8E1F1E
MAVWSPVGRLSAEDLAPIGVLRHRGPDAVARWVSPSGVAALAQARLAVVGVANGDQPVRDESGEVHAVVNGELYGYRQQRRELAERGHRLRTDSDSEITAHLYEEDPERFVAALRGEFAFVLWDERRGRFLAVRDRFGVKPLYYTWIDGRLVVASEVKALFAAGAVRRWDAESFYDYLHSCFAPDRTLFEGIRQVPPGAMLRADDEGVRIVPYWDLDFPLADQVDGPADPAGIERVRERVEEAVLLRLTADVPVGFHLSGGLDSSSVVGVAARHVALRTFTVRFPGSPLDEGEVAGRTAAALGASHHEVSVPDGLPGPAAVAAVTAGEMLQENGHGTARLAQAGAIHDAGLRVVLAGEGGDELFLGYQHLRTDLELGVSAERLARARRSYRLVAAGGVPATLTGALDRLGFLPGWLVDRCLTTTMQARPLLRPDLLVRFADRDSLGALVDRSAAQLVGRAPVHQSLYLFLKTWFCNYILAAERLDMARSVEVRLPLLDHRLFEATRVLPLADLRRGQVKQVLRDAMRGYLTDEVYRGEKRPFFAPAPGSRVAAAVELRQWLGRGHLDGDGFFDPAAVRAFLGRLERGSGPISTGEDRVLHLLGSVSALHDAYGLAV